MIYYLQFDLRHPYILHTYIPKYYLHIHIGISTTYDGVANRRIGIL